MDSARINVPLRASNLSGKKMRKRRELDALVASNGVKRFSAYNGGPVCVKPGTNYHDQLLSESTDDQEDYWRSRNKAAAKRNRSAWLKRKCSSVLNACMVLIIFSCVIMTSILGWFFLDFKHQTDYLQREMDQVVSGNQGIPESVRQCHVQTKELQRNQSEMSVRINGLNLRLSNLSKEISQVSSELRLIQSKLNVSSNLSNVPISIKEMKNWISVLNDTVAQLKQSENRLDNDFHTLKNNVTSFKEDLSSLRVPMLNISNNETIPRDFLQIVNSLNHSLAYLNASLKNEIDSVIKNRSSDQQSLKKVQLYLDQTVEPILANLTSEYILITPLSDKIQSLSDKFISLDSKLQSLSEDVKSLNQTNKADKADASLTTTPVIN